MNTTDDKYSFGSLLETTCRHVKRDHEIRVCMEDGAAWVDLIGPDGEKIELPDSAGKSMVQQVSEAIAVSNGFSNW